MHIKNRSNRCLVLILLTCICSCRQEKKDSRPAKRELLRYYDSITWLDSSAVALKNIDFEKARLFATRAVSFANKSGSDEYMIDALNIKGEVLLVNYDDSAGFLLNRAMILTNTTSFKQKKSHIFYNIAEIHCDANDFKNAITFLDSSINTGYRYGQYGAVASSLIRLASVYTASDDSLMTKTIYDSALTVSTKHNIPRERGVSLGNLARFRCSTHESQNMLKQAIGLLETVSGTESERANFNTNLGLLQQNPDSAAHYYMAAIVLAEKGNMPIEMIGAYNNLTYVYLRKHDVKKAIACMLERAIPLAKKINNQDWLSTLYDSYADVLIAQKKYDEAVIWLRKSTEARTVSDNMIAKKQLRLLNAMLDLKNKNLTILNREQEIILRNARISRLTMVLVIAGSLILLLVVVLIWIRQRTRNRIQHLKLESARKIIEAEEHEKEKTSMELHDAIGILSTNVNEAVENMPGGDDESKHAINTHIFNFSNEVRNISHRMNKKILERHALSPLLINLCQEAKRHGRINLQYSIGEPSTALPVQVSMHVVRIVQELLTNAGKYAAPASVTLSVEFYEKWLEIIYTDNGVGFSREEADKKGMGLSNIFARVNLVNGTATLDTVPDHGVFWKIVIPLLIPG